MGKIKKKKNNIPIGNITLHLKIKRKVWRVKSQNYQSYLSEKKNISFKFNKGKIEI